MTLMTSHDLLSALDGADLALGAPRPRLLLGPGDVAGARERARSLPGYADRLAAAGAAAAQDERVFGPDPEPPYYVQQAYRDLAAAAFLLEDESMAARLLEAIELAFAFPCLPHLEHQWCCRPHIRMRCDHGMVNVSAAIGIAVDLCASFWSDDVVAGISERLQQVVLPPYMETWEKQDLHWALPNFHGNWKIMCCGEGGLTIMACREAIPDLRAAARASLEGVLDILDCVPPEGDWPEGVGYWCGTLGLGLRFGLALHRATGGAVDLFAHPALQDTGDFAVHLTEPDGRYYDLGDNLSEPGAESDYILLLANRLGRGDWARAARAVDRPSTDRVLWDDEALPGSMPDENAKSFPHTGVATMRSAWHPEATFVGLKSGPSAVGHAQLDANSFVLSARGRRLLIDEGKWPYAHHLGFFDETEGGQRWNFDANGTQGHNTLLVDGEGQEFGPEYSGRIVDFCGDGEVPTVAGEAAETYPGRLKTFRRELAFMPPDVLLIHDRVVAEVPRQLEWLFHHRAEVSGDGQTSRFEDDGVVFWLQRLLPAQVDTWRVSDIVRTSWYEDTNTTAMVSPQIRHRSFGPLHPVEEMEVVWLVAVADALPQAELVEEAAQLRVMVALPDGGRQEVVFDRTSESATG